MRQEQLVRAAKAGDAAAFTELYEEIYRDMYRFAYYMLKHTEDAKDAVGDAVADVWAQLATLKKEEAFKSWVFAILSNKCRNKLREYVKRPGELTEALSDTLAAPRQSAPEDRLAVREEFLKLPETDRMIIAFHLFAGYKTKEIAAVLHMNENTVRSRESRALRRMGEALGKE